MAHQWKANCPQELDIRASVQAGQKRWVALGRDDRHKLRLSTPSSTRFHLASKATPVSKSPFVSLDNFNISVAQVPSVIAHNGATPQNTNLVSGMVQNRVDHPLIQRQRRWETEIGLGFKSPANFHLPSGSSSSNSDNLRRHVQWKISAAHQLLPGSKDNIPKDLISSPFKKPKATLHVNSDTPIRRRTSEKTSDGQSVQANDVFGSPSVPMDSEPCEETEDRTNADSTHGTYTGVCDNGLKNTHEIHLARIKDSSGLGLSPNPLSEKIFERGNSGGNLNSSTQKPKTPATRTTRTCVEKRRSAAQLTARRLPVNELTTTSRASVVIEDIAIENPSRELLEDPVFDIPDEEPLKARKVCNRIQKRVLKKSNRKTRCRQIPAFRILKPAAHSTETKRDRKQIFKCADGFEGKESALTGVLMPFKRQILSRADRKKPQFKLFVRELTIVSERKVGKSNNKKITKDQEDYIFPVAAKVEKDAAITTTKIGVPTGTGFCIPEMLVEEDSPCAAAFELPEARIFEDQSTELSITFSPPHRTIRQDLNTSSQDLQVLRFHQRRKEKDLAVPQMLASVSISRRKMENYLSHCNFEDNGDEEQQTSDSDRFRAGPEGTGEISFEHEEEDGDEDHSSTGASSGPPAVLDEAHSRTASINYGGFCAISKISRALSNASDYSLSEENCGDVRMEAIVALEASNYNAGPQRKKAHANHALPKRQYSLFSTTSQIKGSDDDWRPRIPVSSHILMEVDEEILDTSDSSPCRNQRQKSQSEYSAKRSCVMPPPFQIAETQKSVILGDSLSLQQYAHLREIPETQWSAANPALPSSQLSYEP